MNGPKTVEREIDGLQVSTTQLPPFRALVLSKRLMPIVMSMLGAEVDDKTGEVDIESLDIEALTSVLEKMDDAAVQQLMLKLLALTTVNNGTEIHHLTSENAINAAFAGRFPTMLRVAWFAIEVNFFPGGVGALLTSASAPKGSPSTSAT